MTVTPGAAYVAQPNTPESDALARIPHVVEGISDDGSPMHVVLYASDPCDAIDRARDSWVEWQRGEWPARRRAAPRP